MNTHNDRYLTYCFFTSHYLPYLGGVERYVSNLSKTLRDEGNRVIIVTSEMKGEPSKELKDGIVIYRFDSFMFMEDRLPIPKYSRNNRRFWKELNNSDIDYFVVNTKFYPLTLLGTRFAKKRNIPCIVVEHGTGHLNFSNPIVTKIGEIYEHIMANLHYKQCHFFAGVSRECNNWLKHFGIDAVGIMYNAVDYEGIEKIRNECKKTHNRDITIIYSGRLLEEKGIRKLLKAFKIVNSANSDTTLLIAGDGPLREELEKEYKSEKIVFLGHLPFEEMIDYLEISDIFCLPTDYPEGLPTSVLEAMACKSFVITTASGGAKEVITNDDLGIILRENTVDELTQTLNFVIEKEEYRCKTANNACELIKKQYTWDKTKEEMNEIFKRISVL